MPLDPFFLILQGTVYIFTAKHNYQWGTKNKECQKVKYRSASTLQEEGHRANTRGMGYKQ